MRNASLFRSIGFVSLLVMLACEPVDDGAVTRNQGWDGVLTDNVIPHDRDVFIDIEETMPAADGCAKTALDAHAILQNNCGSCHNAGPSSQGQPPFSYIMDDAKLVSEEWVRQTGNLRFVVPGDPDNSMVFVRAAIEQDMPPVQRDTNQPFYPRITFSDQSVLREWIVNCIPGDRPTTPGGAGGSTGAAGAAGAPGGTGTGGSIGSGPDAGTTSDADAGTTTNPACATGVANGGICNGQAVSPCSLTTTTCTCMGGGGGGGQRRWACN